MKKSTILILFAFAILITCFSFQNASAEKKWQCGYQTIRLGERYKSVLSKCGDPEKSYFYENELELRLGTRLTYREKKLIIMKFQNEFLQDVKQTTYEDSPVYLYFDRWGICIRIQEGGKL